METEKIKLSEEQLQEISSGIADSVKDTLVYINETFDDYCDFIINEDKQKGIINTYFVYENKDNKILEKEIWSVYGNE